ncbi:spondin domain-containing protein [Planctobacterium marinum]|uniref:Spondin domain-containing protein n=1 Tax=Planctobacterium marinum TaxID=1631968 RepID=A0AA48HSC2_9ALTE|nr:hypothetical protein MACH26_04690 [Planctobacterium marinum]
MKLRTTLFASAMMATASANAAELTIEFQNLTQGIYYTPILVSAHPATASLFETGEAASAELQMMAEGGDVSGLASIVASVNGNSAEIQAELTAPGNSRTFMLSTDTDNTVLSLTAMLLPTNDAFVGLDNWVIPEEAGTYTVYLNAYDAGTEANDEIRGGGAPGVAGMPVPPPLEGLVGTGGTGVTTEETNTTVHIHRGNLGDSMQDAGVSDINSSVQRWLNPVAKLTVTVQ